jgi:Bacterial regulatory helix-turn-helix protein, lysR family
MKQGQEQPVTLPKAVPGAPLAIELRHLRYFVALADAGSFTHAAERMFIAQPTLSQQIRRLEEIVGTQLIRLPRPMVTHDMVRVGLEDHPLTATAAPVWSGDLPRPLQQILFDAADGIAPPDPAWRAEKEPAAIRS